MVPPADSTRGTKAHFVCQPHLRPSPSSPPSNPPSIQIIPPPRPPRRTMPNTADESTPLISGTSSPRMSSSSSANTWLKVGAVYGALAVGLGAFGAHGLKKHISEPQRLANWQTAAQYHVRVFPSQFLLLWASKAVAFSA
ncbi:uncharacterized protein E0L32_005214 [Thyridium curvatum]|uniref:Uncharacterized protein n=1 Tax=Thyridium curvatum TaxID=1093900 RepID=A0A507AX48_9PEZI|nr:uncharacterized protein E0L32_005214 [Thyridium curvatum]TPX14522.1 hypothetical protein E0L32_005214 [Thyridium curvatum]